MQAVAGQTTSPVDFPSGWYRVADTSNISPSASAVRPYFGGHTLVERGPSGWSVRLSLREEPLASCEALGSVWAWHPGARGGPRTPAYDCPMLSFASGQFDVIGAPPSVVRAPLERAFCDYFDHWHTRKVHRIQSRNTRSWFEPSRCGVSWDAGITPLKLRQLEGLPLRFPMSSEATLFGLSLGVDHLIHWPVQAVNLQANTPIDAHTFEMRTFLGVRPIVGQRWASKIAAWSIIRTIQREIELDKRYWLDCEDHPIHRDPETESEIEQFHRWASALV